MIVSHIADGSCPTSQLTTILLSNIVYSQLSDITNPANRMESEGAGLSLLQGARSGPRAKRFAIDGM